ncbi:MAG TPA: quinone oxidoreductase, partial [Candidatus Limnocylindrales bacterium]|nr:quinone oxidoreductase [Candidatus Limnocylindrales bacterium]
AIPEPGPGQVRVKIAAAGVNYIDTYQRSGQYKLPLPFTPGMEGAGVIDAVGEGITGFAPGDPSAFAFTRGSYAEYAIVPAEKLLPVPEGVDMKVAAGALLQGMTAHYLSHNTFPLAQGQTALIHAAAGGTGALLVQMAKHCGARVIGTAGSEEKAQIAREAGADEVILYRETDFEAEVKRLTDGRGVDVIYDSVGRDTFDKGLNLLRTRGMMVLFGQSSGAVEPVNPQTLNAHGSLYLTRPSLGDYTATRAELMERAAAVFGGIRDGWLKLRIDRALPLAQAAQAHEALTSRATIGKVLLLP